MSDADSEPSVQEVRVIALVSVLDLDNLFVSGGIFIEDRGKVLNEPSKDRSRWNHAEMTTLLRSIKQCC